MTTDKSAPSLTGTDAPLPLGHAFEPSYSDPLVCGVITSGEAWVAADPHRCRRSEAEHKEAPAAGAAELIERLREAAMMLDDSSQHDLIAVTLGEAAAVIEQLLKRQRSDD